MTYVADPGGGFVGNHLTAAALEQLRPAAYNVGRIATVGTPQQTGTYYISQGSGWEPMASVRVLAQSGAPLILPSSGSSNATGQITLTTALPYQPSGTVQIYLPSGVVTAGSQGTGAGMYSVIFSSTTVCQLTGTGIVTANAAYTQTTATSLALVNVSVPAGAMGGNGKLGITGLWNTVNNANAKTVSQTFAANGPAGSIASSVNSRFFVEVQNRGSTGAQVISPTSFSTQFGANANPAIYGTVDTTVAQPVSFSANIATATDYIILEGYTVELRPLA